jgi:hypothetical protein
MVFPGGAPLQQHLSFAVEDENTECPVQKRLPVRFHLFHLSEGRIGFVDEDYFFHLEWRRLRTAGSGSSAASGQSGYGF